MQYTVGLIKDSSVRFRFDTLEEAEAKLAELGGTDSGVKTGEYFLDGPEEVNMLRVNEDLMISVRLDSKDVELLTQAAKKAQTSLGQYLTELAEVRAADLRINNILETEGYGF